MDDATHGLDTVRPRDEAGLFSGTGATAADQRRLIVWETEGGRLDPLDVPATPGRSERSERGRA